MRTRKDRRTMGNDTPHNTEILPPSHREADIRLDKPLRGISLLNRARYWVAKKELEAYIAALRLRNDAIRELDTGQELRTQFYGRTLTRVARLDDLRKIEEEKIANELANLREAQGDREIR